MAAFSPLETVRLGNVDIVTASRSELVDACLADHEQMRRSEGALRPRLVFDANGHAISLQASDAEFRASLDAADIVHADGGFLVTLSRWLCPTAIAERSATTDMIHDLASACSAKGLSFFLLGGSEEINQNCAECLNETYPELKIAGRHHGYFKDDDIDEIAQKIRAADPDIVWVGLGKPREQRVAAALADQISATWIITCGGCFHFITGDYSRAPQWMQKANLEWVHRLATNPVHLFGRYLKSNPHALWLVMADRLAPAKAL